MVLSDGFSEILADCENGRVSWFGSVDGVHEGRMIYPYSDVAEPFAWVSSVHLSGAVWNRLVKKSPA